MFGDCLQLLLLFTQIWSTVAETPRTKLLHVITTNFMINYGGRKYEVSWCIEMDSRT